MAIAVHVINTPNTNVREAYEAAWRRLDEQQARHPRGRQTTPLGWSQTSFTSWTCGTTKPT